MKTFQQQVIEELKVQPVIDVKKEIRRSVEALKDYLRKHPAIKVLVLGISGGQDSTLTAKIAQIAVSELNEELGEKVYSFIAVRLPYGVQKDESDCQDAIQFIQPDEVITVNIKPAVDASVNSLKKAGIELTNFLKGNEKARERMKVQYSIAGAKNGFVLGTDHSAEALVGFFTKHGDGAADVVPIFRLNKRQGKMLLKELGCPEHLYLKTPTADLEDDKPQLPDEVALQVTYDEIDDYLEGKEVKEKSKRRIEELFLNTEHKRKGPVTVFDILGE